MHRTARSTALALMALGSSFHAAGEAEYRLVQLSGFQGAWLSGAHAVNASGVVVGEGNGDPSSSGYPLAVAWPGPSATIQHVAGQGFSGSRASDVNEAGVVVGYADFLPGVGAEFAVGFLLRAGAFTELPSLVTTGVPLTVPASINAFDQVVGGSTDAGGDLRATLWENGIPFDLGTLGGFQSQATHITDDGSIVGWSDRGDGATVAARWIPGPGGYAIEEVVSLGGNYTIATSANRGSVVGWGYGSSGPARAFVWTEGVLELLDSSSVSSEAYDVDESGNVVGVFGARAALWRAGTHELVDLNEVTRGLDGWVLERAEALSSRGVIVGTARDDWRQRAFLLEPLPRRGRATFRRP